MNQFIATIFLPQKKIIKLPWPSSSYPSSSSNRIFVSENDSSSLSLLYKRITQIDISKDLKRILIDLLTYFHQYLQYQHHAYHLLHPLSV